MRNAVASMLQSLGINANLGSLLRAYLAEETHRGWSGIGGDN